MRLPALWWMFSPRFENPVNQGRPHPAVLWVRSVAGFFSSVVGTGLQRRRGGFVLGRPVGLRSMFRSSESTLCEVRLRTSTTCQRSKKFVCRVLVIRGAGRVLFRAGCVVIAAWRGTLFGLMGVTRQAGDKHAPSPKSIGCHAQMQAPAFFRRMTLARPRRR